MTQFHFSHISHMIFILITAILNHTTSHNHVPSQSTIHEQSIYKRYDLTEDNICHQVRLKQKPIELFRRSNSAVIVRLGSIFDRWINQTADLQCKFIIKAPQGEHLMAVIQNITFRRIGGECLDYVQFRRKGHLSTNQTCDKFDRTQLNYYTSTSKNDDYHGADMSYGEYDSEGEIETTIFLSRSKVRFNETPLNITIVYTPSKDCTQSSYNDVCIAPNYFCDGLQNCLANLCEDEKDCSIGIFSNGTGTKVTIGAVTTILLCFIIFLMGLWICRRHKKLCWSTDCAGPSSNTDRFSRNHRDSENSTNQSVPSAPMLQVSVLPSAVDKDLPPSYDSLFPEQSLNPPNTT